MEPDRTIPTANQVRIWLKGPFRLVSSDGYDATPRGKRTKGILALLAASPNHIRTRTWLQDKLWSERGSQQGAGSLRQELSQLRKQLEACGLRLIDSDRDSVWLVRGSFEVMEAGVAGEFLEGIDLPDPEFEDWLRRERSFRENKTEGMRNSGLVSGRPSLIILPFAANGDDPSLSSFAAGLNEELATVLGVLSGVFTVRLPSVSVASGETAYLLEGQVRRDDRYRVTCRLLKYEDRSCVWTGRFDASLSDDLFVSQERIARNVCEATQVTLSDGAWAQIWSGGSAALGAWECFQRGRVQEAAMRRDSTRRAQVFYRRALEIDPAFHQARVSLAFCLMDQLRLGWSTNDSATLAEIHRLHDDIDLERQGDPFVQALQAYILVSSGERQAACKKFENIGNLLPESPELLAYHAVLLGLAGRVDDEVRLLRRALLLTHHPPAWIQTNLAFAYLSVGKVDDAQECLELALAENAESVRALIARIVVHTMRGKHDDAKVVAARVRRLDPDLIADKWRSPRFCISLHHHAEVAAALRRAGL
jgi:TolB-like protein